MILITSCCALPCAALPPLLHSHQSTPAGTTPNVRAAYLVDPVDGFRVTDGKLGYPSAVKLLRDRSMKLGITGKQAWKPVCVFLGAGAGVNVLKGQSSGACAHVTRALLRPNVLAVKPAVSVCNRRAASFRLGQA